MLPPTASRVRTPAWQYALTVAALLAWPQTSHADLKFSLPYEQSFDGLTDLDAGGFICTPAENRCDFQKNQNGTSNDYVLETNKSFSGQKSFRVVMDNVTDPEAFRTEIQSHPTSSDFGEGDVLWVGYALYISETNPADSKWYDCLSQLKLLNVAGTSDLCQIYLLAEDNGTKRFAIREEFSGCGGGSKTYDTGIAATHGTWHRIAIRVDLSHTGGFQVWVDSDDPSAPSFVQASDVFPSAVVGQDVFFKLGIYKSWFRSDVHPEQRIFAEWSYLFDDLRLCAEGSGPCATREAALAWVFPATQSPSSDAGLETPDATGLPDAAPIPEPDAGLETPDATDLPDAAPMQELDAGPETLDATGLPDATPLPELDASADSPQDAAAPKPEDAALRADASSLGQDSGSPGASDADGGAGGPDASTPDVIQQGCGCGVQGAEGSLLLCLLGGVLIRNRVRRS
ncbi:MAG: heparin lyase I family protein [Myxococcales bacterium]